MPNEGTVRCWALEDETFAPQDARARAIGHHAWFDQIADIADTPQIGTKTITEAPSPVADNAQLDAHFRGDRARAAPLRCQQHYPRPPNIALRSARRSAARFKHLADPRFDPKW